MSVQCNGQARKLVLDAVEGLEATRRQSGYLESVIDDSDKFNNEHFTNRRGPVSSVMTAGHWMSIQPRLFINQHSCDPNIQPTGCAARCVHEDN